MNWKFFIFLIVIIFGLTFFFSQEVSMEPNDSSEDLKEEDKDEKEEEVSKKKLAIVIDDLGNSYNMDEGFADFNYSLTLAVLPNRDYSLESANLFQSFDRFETILHLPLEPLDEIHYEEEMIFAGMSKKEISADFEQAYQSLGGNVAGINNHKGSKFTSDEESMTYLLEEIEEKEMYFLDSFTIHTSLGYDLAQQMGIDSCKRDVFLDYEDQESEIREKLYESVNLALEKGEAIAIGHSKEKTLKVLLEKSENIRKMGIDFVRLSEVCH